jgi:DUF1680 family protein
MRGPILYCVEQADNPRVELQDLILGETNPSVRFDPDVLGGVVVLEANAEAAAPDDGWEDRLYRTAYPRKSGIRPGTTTLTAVPYYAWANREPGAMRVWLKTGSLSPA